MSGMTKMLRAVTRTKRKKRDRWDALMSVVMIPISHVAILTHALLPWRASSPNLFFASVNITTPWGSRDTNNLTDDPSWPLTF